MNLQLKQLDRGENKCREEEIMRIFNIIKNTKRLVIEELEVGSIIVDTCHNQFMLVKKITEKYICYYLLSEEPYHTNWEGKQLTVNNEHLFNNYIYKVYKYSENSHEFDAKKITKTSLSNNFIFYRHYSNNNDVAYKIELNIVCSSYDIFNIKLKKEVFNLI